MSDNTPTNGGVVSGLVLDVGDLTVGYGNGPAVLTGVDLHIAAGECLALVGESGCGKTTLARAILGLLPKHARTAGTIDLHGRPILDLPPRAMRAILGVELGYVAQDPYAACDPLRTVGHHVEEAWRAHGGRPTAGQVAARLDALQIHAAATRLGDHPYQWSGGMLQRASIAAATAHHPALTIADEPTSALDADLADGVLATLRQASPTLLLISHDLRLIAGHADRVAVIHDGRIVETGPADDVINHPAHDYTRQLLGAARAIRARPSRATHVSVTSRATHVSVTSRATHVSVTSHATPGVVTDRATVVTADDVSVSYRTGRGTVTAVRGASLTIGRGEVVGIAGASGSGKSSLLRVLGGIEEPHAGRVTFTADALPHPPPGYVMPVFQDPVASLDRRWPIWRSITEPLTITKRLSSAERLTLASGALARVNLADLDPTRLPGQLSVGQCQRVAIARALIAEPALVIADEPTASLDVTTAAQIIELLRVVADAGIALAVVSHDRPLLAALCDRTLTMSHGILDVDPTAQAS